jgi:hypothetical protein
MQPSTPHTIDRTLLALWAVVAFLVTGSLASARLYTLPRLPKFFGADDV